MKPFSPCKDCQERTFGCHGTCEKYQKYLAELDKYKRYEQINRDAYHVNEHNIKKYRRELLQRNR